MSEASLPNTFLEQISTRWPLITNPIQFVMRYAPAIQAYLGALIKNPHDREEVCQDFLVRVVERGFIEENLKRGRFRDYLKAAVRNAALTFFRRADRRKTEILPDRPAPEEGEETWTAEWRRTLLEQVWEKLELQQRSSPGNLYHTVLRLATTYPDEDSEALAARVTQQTAQTLRAEAFRKQLSRGRRAFAKLLIREVKQTLEEPTADGIQEELVALGLLEYVRPFLSQT